MDRKWQLPPENRHGLSMKPLSIKLGHAFNKNSTIYILSTFFKASLGVKKAYLNKLLVLLDLFCCTIPGLHNTNFHFTKLGGQRHMFKILAFTAW